MRFAIDTEASTLLTSDGDHEKTLPLYSDESFKILSDLWLKVGWNQKYTYTFSWMGRPIIQLPEDMIRMQEVIYRVRPTIIIETGVAHGGSLIYYASLLRMMSGQGKVIGVDIEIRAHNRVAIEQHELARDIILIEGDSVAPETTARVKSHITPDDKVLVILDSNHAKEHVRKELEAYSSFVTAGSYIVATDGIMRDLPDVPRGHPDWQHDHPAAAAEEFAANHREFTIEQPAWVFNESNLKNNVTHWPSAWLKRV